MKRVLIRLFILLIIGIVALNYIKEKTNIVTGVSKIVGTNVLLVNRTHRLNSEYVPDDLVKVDINFLPESTEEEHYMKSEAAAALKDMVEGAAEDNIILTGLSGYRSYDTQKNLYQYNVQTQGASYADDYVAKAGASEHQLGEAMDIATASGWITEGCAEAEWIAENCYKYGFIVRYQRDKEDITGYSYEPWHVRYVGKKLAEKAHESGKTLEEFMSGI